MVIRVSTNAVAARHCGAHTYYPVLENTAPHREKETQDLQLEYVNCRAPSASESLFLILALTKNDKG